MAGKTFIAIPCMDQVPAPFMASLAQLRDDDLIMGVNVGSLIYNSRNELAKRAIATESEFCLWLDSDMVFQPDLLKRLKKHFENPETEIVSGVYFRRSTPYTPVLYDKLEIDAKGNCEFHELETLPKDDKPFEVAGIGFGGVLMRTSVLMDVFGLHRMPFAPINGVGEDLSFCWRAREAGHKIICDPTIELGHVGHITVNRQFYDVFHKERG